MSSYLKVFLAEDEYVVREGIKNNIDWKANGYEFVGEATDGELAYPMIQKLRPDIVITDIRMPFMDGLELSRLIRKELPETEIIILSGYAEFSYAREAIKLGVAEYLTKPINGSDLISEMNKVAARIYEKQHDKEIREKYLKEIEENQIAERRELFNALAAGSLSVPDILERGEKLKINLSSLWYNVLLLGVSSLVHEYDEYSGSLLLAQKRIEELAEQSRLISFDRGLEGLAVLFTGDSENELAEKASDFISELEGALCDLSNIRYFGGLGIPVNRLRLLPEAFESASHAYAHRYLISESRIIKASEIRSVDKISEESIDLSSVNVKSFDRSKITAFLKMGEAGESVYFADEFMDSLGAGALNSTIFKQYIVLDIYFCVCEFLTELGIEKSLIKAPEMNSEIMKSRESLRAYVADIFRDAIVLREQNAGSHRKDVVNAVIDYIENNYSNDELALNEIAAHVNFSPSHLSTVFSTEVGTTIVKYLTDYRMNRAKELLRCTSKKSSVISEEVGYKDPHYFSYLFKKTQGVTPTQFRGIGGSPADERNEE